MTYPAEDTNWVAERQRIKDSIRAELPKLNLFWRRSRLANGTHSSRPSKAVKVLLEPWADREDYLDQQNIFQAYEPFTELRNSLVDGCKDVAAGVEARPVLPNRRHVGHRRKLCVG